MVRHLIATGSYLLFMAGCLFLSAQTTAWPAAWGLLAFTAASILIGAATADPDIVRERESLEYGLQGWDVRIATVGFVFLVMLPLVVAGFDLKRYGWSSPLPIWVRSLAAVVMVLGSVLGWWAMRANRFFVKFVRIQHDRGHHVVRSGPYAYVRHPGYVGGIALFAAMPIVLGSRWGLLPALIGAALFVRRTVLEDRFLQDHLPGYREYAEQVRWRLVPGWW